ncbi:hypothetical protein Y032_0016g2928 [Ancylostoma ceylanicum]|uniref:Tc1-like transposase DDE domain-containing protein n=1 Tax=Ancylostoma ceylanicum TaxID=53326 RepID=A0A016V4Z3_9BILA|nr:hypothetical protein Y032_0016g2928 [Ancylostoma ceylanicum]
MVAHPQRSSIVDLYRAEYATKDIVGILSVPRRTEQREVQKFKSTGEVSDHRRSGRPRSVVNRKNVDNIHKRIARYAERSMRRIAADLWMSEVRRIVHENLGLRIYRLQKCQAFCAANRLTRVRRCKELLKRAANDAHLQFVFSDEKLFSVEATFNRQNKRIIARNLQGANSSGRLVAKKAHSASVMACTFITSDGKSPLIFVDP